MRGERRPRCRLRMPKQRQQFETHLTPPKGEGLDNEDIGPKRVEFANEAVAAHCLEFIAERTTLGIDKGGKGHIA